MIRKILQYTISVLLAAHAAIAQTSDIEKVPVIVITDLYHPYQDPGDNFDLIAAYALPEVALKAVILDITDAFRKPVADHPALWADPRGPREAGIIPLMQLNYIFNRQVPFAVGPLSPMKSPGDRMNNAPGFEQAGIDLLLKTLRESREKVSILSFGSARVLAVAYNREPELFHKKVQMIHLSAGTASPDFKLGTDKGANAIPGGEWNVALDVHGFVRLLRSDLPVAVYPCAGVNGGFSVEPHNTYWLMPDLQFIRRMDSRLQRYLHYAFTRSERIDFLRAMDADGLPDSAVIHNSYPRPHHVWETALWLQVTGRVLVERGQGHYQLVGKEKMPGGSVVVSGVLRPCTIHVRDDGRLTFRPVTGKTNFSIYERADPRRNVEALQQVVPGLYMSFRVCLNRD